MTDALKLFIQQHEHDNIAELLLRHKEIEGYPVSFVANQLNGRRRAKEKLPSWYAHPNIIYPPQQNLEQCSSELTAKFKSNFIKNTDPSLNLMIDLTGGFGVDSFFFSKIFEKVVHVEPDEQLCRLAQEHSIQLETLNIDYSNQNAAQFLSNFSGTANWIYLDPSRKSNGKKLVKLQDCEPDVIELLPMFWSKASQILIKTSPLLDIKMGLNQLPHTIIVVVLSVDGECKEVLVHLQKNFSGVPEIQCVNLKSEIAESFSFNFLQEQQSISHFSEPLEYLFEPNASILKAGAFKIIGLKYGLKKLAISTHLYTGDEFIPDFPGRIFKIIGSLSANAKLLSDGKVNIISRNHPLTPADIKKKFKLKDGGELYLLAFSGETKKFLLIAERLK